MFESKHPRLTRTSIAAFAATIVLFAGATTTSAQLPVLVRMDRLSPHETKVDVFSITTPQSVEIEATGADERFPKHGKLGIIDRVFGSFNYNSSESDAWRGNAWIVDADTRRVVWELRASNPDHGSEGMRGFKGTVRLEPGTYEAYYASYSAWSSTYSNNSNERLTKEQIRARTKYEDDGVSKKFNFTVRGNGQALPSTTYLQNIDAYRRNALVSLTGLKANETRKAGFSLDRPTKIDVYAVGEVREEETFDYGWIINADTHERVWALDFRNSRPAGGAVKNRAARQTVTLPAGRYAAIYTLDDSHDIEEWNAAPPYDPGLWGMTLRLADPADRAHVKLFDYQSKPANAFVALTGVGDHETRTAGFTLKKAMDVRVYALGEGTDDDMDDYGWITEAKTHRRVWSMKYLNTQHAGGDRKNRVASDVIHLDAGSYIVNYRTDDSHSAEEWNSGPPIDGDMWGITVAPVNAGDRNAVAEYDANAEEDEVITKLTRMEDDENARATFSLDRPTDVRIYAIGEGRDNQMFDYGYIEERGTRRRVWEMKYRSTTHAGGTTKNRMFDDVVRLPAGDYVVRWVSDDSHSYDSWNDDAPEDQLHWGITLYRASR